MPGVVLGYVLAGNPLFDVRALAWAFFALLFHAFGFLQNNIFDYDYDKKDPSKAHHPLMTGEITVERAMGLDVLLCLATVALQIALSLGNPIPTIVLLISILFGTLYNYLCKRTLLGPLLITASLSTLVMVPYLSYASTLSPLMWLLVAFTAFLMLYQISVSGYLKDFKQTDEVNLLRAMGSRLEGDDLKLSLQAKAYAYTLTSIKFLLSGAIAVGLRTVTWAFLGAGSMAVAFLLMSSKLTESGPFKHDKRVKQMALVEVLSYFALVFAVEGAIGWMGVAALVLLPMLWFVVMNRIIWGTRLTPRV